MDGAISSGEWAGISAIQQSVDRLNGENFSDADRISIGLCYGISQISHRAGVLEKDRKAALDLLLGGESAD
jgi:hypothetical protein